MPVSPDGLTFMPAFRMCAAEEHVAWTAINRHVLEQRAAVERTTAPIARRVGFLVGSGIIPAVPLRELEAKLASGLMQTFAFGRDEARRELAALRARQPAPTPSLAAERSAAHPDNARRKFQRLATEGAAEVQRAAAAVASEGPVASSGAAVKALHLVVLATIGQSLNLGRTYGAVTAPGGSPAFAMRSEMLDKSLCDRCSELHGTIVQVESDDYYTVLPPASCLGGGRCRGMMIFADGVSDLRGPG